MGVPLLPLAGKYPVQLHSTQLTRDNLVLHDVHVGTNRSTWRQKLLRWGQTIHPVFHFYSCVFGWQGMKERENILVSLGCLLGGAGIQISFNHCECCSITLNHTVEFHESHSVTDI